MSIFTRRPAARHGVAAPQPPVTPAARTMAGQMWQQVEQVQAAAPDTQPFDTVLEFAGEPVFPYWNPGRTVAVDLAGVAAEIVTPRPGFAADWRDLKHFRATCKTVGWCGLAMRRGTS